MVHCLNCQNSCSADARFCDRCGNGLAAHCESCSAELLPTASYCVRCGAPTQASSTVGFLSESSDVDRRQIAVLIADLVGSTELTARFDPEDWRTITNQYEACAKTAMDTFGGFIAQYRGDGVLAYFGYPTSYEDNTDRAVRAACMLVNLLSDRNKEIEEQFGIVLAVRVGVHTGRVVAEKNAMHEPFAFGSTANIAARLEGIAKKNSVVISDESYALLRASFEVEDLGDHRLKGIANAIRAYRIVGLPENAQPASVTQRERTPFVGREREMSQLQELWRSTLRGRGSLALVSGEAGIGKSRLIHEFVVENQLRGSSCFEFYCSPFLKNSPFGPFRELLRRMLLSKEGTASETVINQLREIFGDISPQQLFVLGDFLGIHSNELPAFELTAERRRELTFLSLSEWLMSLLKGSEILFVIEDIHWADPSSIELINQLAEILSEQKALMLVSTRPEETQFASIHAKYVVSLGALDNDSSLALLSSLSREDGKANLSEIESIVDRASGIPLYLEELRNEFFYSKYEESASTIPPTLQGLLAARLDRLGQYRKIAQFAATLGEEFRFDLLSIASGYPSSFLNEGLESLISSGVIVQQQTSPVRSYRFRHALIHNAACESLLAETRRSFSKEIVFTLEKQFPQYIEGELEQVARYCEQAGLFQKAVDYIIRAAIRLIDQYALEEVAELLYYGLKLLQQLPESKARDDRELIIRMNLGAAQSAYRGLADKIVRENYERVRKLCAYRVASPETVEALSAVSIYLNAIGDIMGSYRVAEELLAMADASGDVKGLLAGHALRSQANYFLGNFARSVEDAEKVFSTWDEANLDSPRFSWIDILVYSFQYKTMSLAGLGKIEASEAAFRAGLRYAEDSKSLINLAVSWYTGTNSYAMYEELSKGEECALRCLEIADQCGLNMYKVKANTAIAISRAYCLQIDTLNDAKEALNGVSNRGSLAGAPSYVHGLALIHRSAGRLEEALKMIELAITFSSSTQQHYWDGVLYTERGELYELLPNYSDCEAEQEYRRGLKIASEQSAELMAIRTAVRLARLLAKQRRVDEARAVLLEKYDNYQTSVENRIAKEAEALLQSLR